MIMASLGMGEEYKLSDIIVSMIVPENVIGNYAFGYIEENIFMVCYVGRSDTDLRQEIKHKACKLILN